MWPSAYAEDSAPMRRRVRRSRQRLLPFNPDSLSKQAHLTLHPAVTMLPTQLVEYGLQHISLDPEWFVRDAVARVGPGSFTLPLARVSIVCRPSSEARDQS